MFWHGGLSLLELFYDRDDFESTDYK